MKKTIKEDNERKILKQEYLSENSLLEYIEEKDKVFICVRYIENSYFENGIKEMVVAVLSKEEYETELNNIIEISENNNAIAVFKKRKKDNTEEYYLEKVCMLDEHKSESSDFVDCAYALYFPGKKLGQYLNRI